MNAARSVRFDRGTVELGQDVPALDGVLWDPRTSSRRMAAYRYADLVARVDAAQCALAGDLRDSWSARPRDTSALELRSYQREALAAWTAFARRGVVVLPTGAGKTRVAIAAIFASGLPTAVLCPTRALASAWLAELGRWLDHPVGLIGDGERRVERVTVMTFESAFRHMDTLGDRFGLLVVDEIHHFGSGARLEALEASPAVARLGLTATAPKRGTEQAARIEALVGPVVFEMGYEELVGKDLAPVDFVRIYVRLEDDEREQYLAWTRAFGEMRRAFLRSYPGADIASLLRALGRSPEGLRALRDHARARELAGFPRAKRALVRTLLDRHRTDRTIIFTAFAENAYALALDNLVPVIAAETSARERQDILARFRDGKLRAIASARVLNEGIDVPEARVALIVAGTLGEREHIQRIGRVLRPAPEKRALVYELLTTGTADARRAGMRTEHAPHTAA
ncbi:DEAD/DEAH box helicase family protein [soil metagenome]